MFVIFGNKKLPFKMPRSSRELDYNDMAPGSKDPKKADGISFFGNDRKSSQELWFTNTDLRTHILIFGSTGSGKTEALVSIAFNSLVHGSGFIYIDGKGDNSLFAKIFSMVRAMGRDDDILLINFMTGARDILGPQVNRLSNTMNPFANGSSSMLSQLVTSLMDSGSNSGDGDMWKGRAINFVESLMKILTVMRDAGHILLDANTIRNYFILEKLESIVVDKQFPVGDGDFKVPINDLPAVVLEPLKNYVINLPGYNPKNKFNQAGEVREQHGFITMQLTRVFGSLADTYGHIIRTNLAEVDLKDVVLNRRILVVLLPALEKSPDELSNLGKVIIASLKAMMASGLGDKVEGDYRDVILTKPTNSPSPYVCIMDEYGYYAVKGFAVVPAQARSLGFSAVFAGQDLPAFQKASKEEAASIGANCNIKICMKLEDPMETWEYFNKTAGETYVTNVSGFQMDSGSFSLNYMDTRNASIDRKQRIDLLDLKDQREGEAHIFFQSKIVRAEMFFANPKPVKSLRINHLLKVELPSTQGLIAFEKRVKLFKLSLRDAKLKELTVFPNSDIDTLKESLLDPSITNPLDRGINGMIAILEKELAKQKQLSAAHEPKVPKEITKKTAASNDLITFSVTSIFTGVPITNLVAKIVNQSDHELFKLPLLRRASLSDNLKNVEQLSGMEQELAINNANNVVNDLSDITTFPHQSPGQLDLKAYLKNVNDIIKFFGGEPLDGGSIVETGELKEEGFDTESQLEDEEIDYLEDILNDDLDDIIDNGPELPLQTELPDLPGLEDEEDTG